MHSSDVWWYTILVPDIVEAKSGPIHCNSCLICMLYNDTFLMIIIRHRYTVTVSKIALKKYELAARVISFRTSLTVAWSLCQAPTVQTAHALNPLLASFCLL